MCPVCIATFATVAAGITSAGGMTTFVLDRLVRKNRDLSRRLAPTITTTFDPTKENAHGDQESQS